MSSEPAPHTGRCLLCSLGCPLELEEYSPQRWRPRLNGPDGATCARGQTLPDLLHSPERLYRPFAGAQPRNLTAILADLRRRTDESARVTLWLDGSLALEDLAAARAFCAQHPDRRRVVIHLPPCELGAVEGLDAAAARQAAPATWTEADGLLVLGNPLATHPAAARGIVRTGAARGRTPLVAIDSAASVLTANAASALICRPGYEFWVVGALLNALSLGVGDVVQGADIAELERTASAGGISPGAIRSAAGRLRDCRRPAVIIAPPSGRREVWRAATVAAARWAQSRGGGVSVLTATANAFGFARCARRHGLEDWHTLAQRGQADEVDVLFVAGWDPTSAYPRALWEPLLRSAGQRVVLSPFLPYDMNAFHACIPLALPAEAGGSYILADGGLTPVGSVMGAPSGVPTLRMLLADLGAAAGHVAAADYEPAPLKGSVQAPRPPVADTAQAGWPAVLIADPTQYFDGHLTRHAQWSRRVDPLPELRLAPRDAQALGVREGQHVRIHNGLGAAFVRATLAAGQPLTAACYVDTPGTDSGGQPAGWLAVGGSTPAVRQLSALRAGQADDNAAAGVLMIELDAAIAQPAWKEAAHVGR